MTADDSDTHDRVEAESAVNDSFGTTIPSEVRNALADEVEPGDTVRWTVTDGRISVEIVSEQYGLLAQKGPATGDEEIDGVDVTENYHRYD